jgi:formylglycine-generating enzyme required for sulfatase activity
MERLLARHIDAEVSRRVVLGLNHEQQHQELALTDIKHAFFSNPLRPSYEPASLAGEAGLPIPKLNWHSIEGGLIESGCPVNVEDPLNFCFDNETPRHRVYLPPFQIANREITCREYLEFMADDSGCRMAGRH